MNVLLSVLLLFAPAVKMEHGHFKILKDGTSIGSDDFTLSLNGASYVLESKITIGDMTMTSRLELTEKLVPVSYELTSSGGTTRVSVASPLSELETVINGETSSANFRFPEGALILDNNIFDHYLVMMFRVQAGEMNFPVFVPQDRSVGRATVRMTGPRSYDLEVGDVKMEATVDADGTLTKLSVPAAKVVVER